LPQRPKTPRDPFAVGAGLDHDPSPGSIAKHGRREARWLRPNPALDQFTALGQDADLAFPLVDVDANMIHGWPLLTAALTAGFALVGPHRPPRQARGQPLHPIYARRWLGCAGCPPSLPPGHAVGGRRRGGRAPGTLPAPPAAGAVGRAGGRAYALLWRWTVAVESARRL